MKFKILKPLLQAAGLGVIAGMRSATAPAVISHILSNHPSKNVSKSGLGFIQSKKLAVVLKVFAAGELIADKLPNTPNRTQSAGVIFRCLSGALAGACIFKANGNNGSIGALIGSAAALGSTYACFAIRKNASIKYKISDPVLGATEDVLALGAGFALIKTA